MKLINYRSLYLLLLSSLLMSCNRDLDRLPVTIDRFDKAMVQWIRSGFNNSYIDPYVNDTSDYFNIYCKGVWGLEGDMRDLWVMRLSATFKNEHLQKLSFDTESRFNDLVDLQNEIGIGLYYLNDILPNVTPPRKIYTHISGLQQSIVIASDFVSIALDKYLGADYPMYQSYFYDYQCKTMDARYIPRDLFRLLLLDAYPNIGDTLLDRMVYEGKILYALSCILPDTPIENLCGFTADQMAWCKKNEKSMWHYLITEDYLYSEDINILNKFLGDASFTNDFGEESPGKSISWIGYRIVKLYVGNEEDSLDQLFRASAQSILKDSKFKY